MNIGSGQIYKDSSGNVGIGTSSPATKLQVSSSTGPSSDDYGFIQANYTGTTTTVNSGITVKNYQGTSQFMQWEVNGLRVGSRIKTNTGTGQVVFTYGNDTEAMRIDASGNLLVNTATAWSRLAVQHAGASQFGITDVNTDTSGVGQTSIAFVRNGSYVGTINTTSSATSYNTSSDYRLKNSVTPMSSGLATVAALKPVTYKWNIDDSDGEGFIAHELQEFIPHAVTGEKDAVDAEGNAVHQGVDYSKIVVHLVAACQELKAQNDELKARVAALEAK